MKRLIAITFTLLILVGCSKEKTEVVKMGNKDSNLLEIQNFSDSKRPKNIILAIADGAGLNHITCLLYTSPSPRDMRRSRMPSSA